MLFSELGLQPEILKSLEKKGYTSPTEIQEKTIQAFTSGKHIVGQSQTGTGKTAAFVIPLLNAIDPKSKGAQVIVMCPTRELATQTEEEFFNLSRGLIGVKTCTVAGGMSVRRQQEKLQQGAQFIIATPGRLMDLIDKRIINLSKVSYVVLDEADRMFDMGFRDDIDYILSKIPAIKQMMSFSATVTPELQQLLGRYIGSDYTNIKIAAQSVVVDKIDHSFIRIQGRHKEEMLEKYLEAHKDQKILIFTQMKHVASTVARNLHDQGYKVAALHGDIDQRVRNITIKDIKADKVKILVATDVASRGLNLNDIQLVINYDVPQDPESYVHRIGRTARAGQSGKAITLVTESEMGAIHAIERKNKIQIKEIDAEGNEKPRTYTKQHDAGFAYRRSRSGGGYRGRSGGGSRGGYSSGGRSSDRPTYSSSRPTGDKPAFGGDRPARPAGDRPSYGASRPSYGSDRPRGDRPAYGASRPSYGADRGAPRSDAGGRGGYSDRPARPAGDRPSYGASRPSYGSDRPRGDRPAHGSSRPSRPQRPERRSYDR